MSRETRLNRTVRRALERRLEKIEPKKRPLRQRIAGWLLFLIGIPGIVAALLTFLPRVSVNISDPVDLDNTFSALVTVTNTGNIPLKDVLVTMGIGVICTQGASNCPVPEFPDPRREYPSRYRRSQILPRDLKIDDHFTIALDDITYAKEKGGLEYADIAVIVSYKLPYIFLSKEKTFPLYTRKASNGKLYWQWK
jgi:hypothetical protein